MSLPFVPTGANKWHPPPPAFQKQPGVLPWPEGSWPGSWCVRLLKNISFWWFLHSPNPSLLYFVLLSPLHSDLPVGKSKRSLNLCPVLIWKTHTQQHFQGQKSLRSCFVITQHVHSADTKRREQSTKVSTQKLVKKGQNKNTRFFSNIALLAWEKSHFLIQDFASFEMSVWRNSHYSSTSPTVYWTPSEPTLTGT